MPELPEVETIRRDLARRIVGKKIKAVEVRDKKIVSFSSVILSPANAGKNLLSFGSFLCRQKFIRIERRGKLLAFLLSNGQYLLTHLKMTGQLIYLSSPRHAYRQAGKRGSAPDKSRIPAFAGMTIAAGGHKISAGDLQVPNKFTRVIFTFADKSQLFFNDMRRFGYMKIADKKEKEIIWSEDFGIEPLTKGFKFKDFAALFNNRKTNIKALLMNQKLIAGVGNIYADEACWCAGLLPWRKAAGLKPTEMRKLFSCITGVLKIALKNRGTSFSNFVDAVGDKGGHYNFLKVYERDGLLCLRCNRGKMKPTPTLWSGSITRRTRRLSAARLVVIEKTRHAGRGTHYCPRCQK